MAEYLHEKQATDFDAIRLAVASPDRILEWSHGKVTKPETINYRTQKPEKDGLFCERIFGPTKDWECYCGKYKGAHYRGVVCDRCGVLVARSIVRRERMGHIELAVPVTHVWFLRGTPSTVGLILNMTSKNLEKVVYFAAYLVTDVDQDKKKATLKKLEADFKAAKTAVEKKFEKGGKNADKLKEQAEARSAEVSRLEDEYAAAKAIIEELNPKTLMSESEYRQLKEQYGELFSAKIGAEAVMELLSKIDLDKTVKELSKTSEEAQGQRRRKLLKRLKMMEGMKKAKLRPDWMVVKYLPVIPPDLRPMVQLTGGRFATSDLNDLYRRVINRNNRLQKLMDMNAPEVICRNEMRMLQEAVDALIDNSHARGGRAVSSTGGRRKLKSLSDMLRGKQGRFRQNLLGKRVDYSGRSVIVAGPELKLDECGIPKMMALELFKPFIIGTLIERELAHNVKIAGRMIEAGEAEVWDALDEVIKDKYVLLNRAPTLHRLGVQAFKPVLIEGKAVQLHPLVCKGFNADFDGDQMAVHLPLSEAAQAEARTHMAANRNLLKPSDGSSIIYIAQDMVLGIYYMTYERYPDKTPSHSFSSTEDAHYSYEQGIIKLQDPIKLRISSQVITTTLGRALFNEVLPDGLGYLNETMDDKRLQQLLTELFEGFGEELTAITADRMKEIGFEYATVSGLSTGLDDYITPVEKTDLLAEGERRASEISEQYEQGLITDDERQRLTVEAWRSINDRIQEILKERFNEQDNSTTITVLSGARAKLSAVSQIAGMLGLRQDVYGNTIELPVKSNYKEGLSSVEYFIDARGSRKGLVDTALKTADAGYLTRRLVDVSQDVFTIEDDCGDKVGLTINREESEAIGEEFKDRLVGRIAAADIKIGQAVAVKRGEQITKASADKIIKAGLDQVTIRSVLKCLSIRGICRMCYGVDLGRGNMVELRVPVGVIAAQAVGEPGTQLTLRTFHHGGVAEEDITHGFPRIEELFEARNPKGQALLSEISGVVSVREEGNQYVLTVRAPSAQASEYDMHGMVPAVKKGDKVTIGDVLAHNDAGQEGALSKTSGVVSGLNRNSLTVTSQEGAVVEYTVPGYRTLVVKDGDMAAQGQRLTTGSINLQDYLRLTDEATVQRYIMTEIQSIFNLQGQTIADKHLEVIVRQMFSRVQIEDPGDSLFVTGDIVSKALVIEENNRLAGEKKRQLTYKQLLLGIIKVSTWSDSFLSAASFQDTTRVLISSATAGRIDRLYGLKENVIIGRQIPVGTGYHGIDPNAE